MNRACRESVAISAVSLVSCIGSTLSEITDAMTNGTCGLTKDHQWYDRIPAPVGQISVRWIEDAIAYSAGDSSLTRLQLVARYLVGQLFERENIASRYKPQDIGLSISTTSAGLESWLARLTARGANWSRENPRDWFGIEDHGGTLADSLIAKFPIRGPDVTFSTACSGGALAIARGVEMIRRCEVKACIVGGLDILTSMTMCGFNALQVMDHELCRPFHPERKGMNLAEGGAFFLLEKHASDSPLGYVTGYGVSTDYFHMTQPHPSGDPMALSMGRALGDASWQPSEIGYINAHGTGTPANDASESTAITSMFGHEIFYNSTKALHGHTLAGAGALEAAIAVETLRSGSFFWDQRLGQKTSSPDFQKDVQRKALSNSFGFGGHNVTLALSADGDTTHA